MRIVLAVIAVMLAASCSQAGVSQTDRQKYDSLTGALMTIEYPHHEVHSGNTWQDSHITGNLTDGSTFVFLLVCGAKNPHISFDAAAGGDSRLVLYENPVVVSSGNLLSARNMNRTSANAATLIVYSTPTVTTTGTELFTQYNPGGAGNAAASRNGGSFRSGQEWILRAGYSYLYYIRNISGATKPAELGLQWYEE